MERCVFMRCNLGVYEKAMPGTLTWREKLLAAGSAGFDFVEMSVDETDEKLARLAWAPEQRRELRTLAACLGTDIRTMCLSGHRRFPIGSHEKAVRQKGMSIMDMMFIIMRYPMRAVKDILLKILQSPRIWLQPAALCWL